MEPNASPLPVGQSPPLPPQSLRATLWQLLGVGEQQIMPEASRRSNTLIFTIIGTLTLLAFGIGNVQQTSDARLFTLGLVQLLHRSCRLGTRSCSCTLGTHCTRVRGGAGVEGLSSRPPLRAHTKCW